MESQEKEIQRRVLEGQQNDLLEAFFRALHNDDEEGMKKVLGQIRELDGKNGTHEIEKLFNWVDNIELLQGTSVEKELYKIKSLYNLKNPPEEGV